MNRDSSATGVQPTDHERVFIGGRWLAPSSGARTEVVSASTEQPLGSAPECAAADVDAAVACARMAFDDPYGWAHWEPNARAAALESLARELDAQAGDAARRLLPAGTAVRRDHARRA